MNLLDDLLSSDLARDGALTASMYERFMTLSRYAVGCKADAILFTCSAFGPCIEKVAEEFSPMPVLKPNEAMIEDAVGTGKKIGLIASFAPTLQTLPKEFPPDAALSMTLAEGALAALDGGDGERHDQLVAEAARRLEDCDVIALTQFSLARAASAVAAATGKQVLTTPDSAVVKLKRVLQG